MDFFLLANCNEVPIWTLRNQVEYMLIYWDNIVDENRKTTWQMLLFRSYFFSSELLANWPGLPIKVEKLTNLVPVFFRIEFNLLVSAIIFRNF